VAVFMAQISTNKEPPVLELYFHFMRGGNFFFRYFFSNEKKFRKKRGWGEK